MNKPALYTVLGGIGLAAVMSAGNPTPTPPPTPHRQRPPITQEQSPPLAPAPAETSLIDLEEPTEEVLDIVEPAPAVVKPVRTYSPPPPPPPEPEPAPTSTYLKPAAETPTSSCDPNYAGCVPIASDVDCAGGSGDGPAYVSGPIQVIGRDIYRLDRDKDGWACE